MKKVTRLSLFISVVFLLITFLAAPCSFAAGKKIVLRLAGTWQDKDGRVPMIKEFINNVKDWKWTLLATDSTSTSSISSRSKMA